MVSRIHRDATFDNAQRIFPRVDATRNPGRERKHCEKSAYVFAKNEKQHCIQQKKIHLQLYFIF
jgi:hypothetical protein